MTSLLDWHILEALDDQVWRANFYARLAGWPKTGMCWEWTGAVDDRGFGRVRLPVWIGGVAHPHRVTWLHRHGHVHPGLVLRPDLKGCGGRACANPGCWVEGAAGRTPRRVWREARQWRADQDHRNVNENRFHDPRETIS